MITPDREAATCARWFETRTPPITGVGFPIIRPVSISIATEKSVPAGSAYNK